MQRPGDVRRNTPKGAVIGQPIAVVVAADDASFGPFVPALVADE
jgi:hypothetical protein